MGNFISLKSLTTGLTATNCWEISLKYKLGKLDLGDLTPHGLFIASKENNFKVIKIDANIMATLYQLPLPESVRLMRI